MTLDEFLGRLEGVKTSGDGWVARCPAHQDERQSLSIALKGIRILVKCHAGCRTPAIVRVLGLTMADLFTEPRAPRGSRGPSAKVVARYDYRKLDGTLLYQAVRLEPKAFYQRRPDGRGGWLNNLKGVTERTLYRLPDLGRTS